ncbi:MAG: hypothetical protein AAGE52_29305 [Myxococcota bacterium]
MFVVGLNHPWIECGHDFGRRPPPWQGAGRTDWERVRADLDRWRTDAGITWSRWWLLAGGVNYPVGQSPDVAFERIHDRHGQQFQLRPDDRPLALTPEFLDDFEALLRVASLSGIRLVPSLLSFEFFFPAEQHAEGNTRSEEVWSGGRKRLVVGRDDEPVEAAVDAFLDATLSPLLEVSKRHPRAIGAWEVINEPDWVTEGGPLHARLRDGRIHAMPKTVSSRSMCVFLERAVDRIVSAGFLSSIGFKQGNPDWITPRLFRRLQALSRSDRYLHQLHYYPSLHEPAPLPHHKRLPFRPCVVGEMPTHRGGWLNPFFMRWLDDLDFARASDPNRYLERRLDIVRRRGYPGAWLWSGQAGDDASAWGPAERAQVRAFLSRG